MKSTLEPTHQSTCMKCRTASARYYGKWAAEGPDIRLKVLRDMHPADRKRWQLDGLLSTGDEGLAPPPAGAEPTERELAKMMEAVEAGGEEALRDVAVTIGVKVVVGPNDPTRKER